MAAESPLMDCPDCGELIGQHRSFCSECGWRAAEPVVIAFPERRVAATKLSEPSLLAPPATAVEAGQSTPLAPSRLRTGRATPLAPSRSRTGRAVTAVSIVIAVCALVFVASSSPRHESSRLLKADKTLLAAKVIGPNGGNLTFPGGRVVVPMGALRITTEVVVRRHRVAGLLDDASAAVWAYKFGPADLSFAAPVRVALRSPAAGGARAVVVAAGDVNEVTGRFDRKTRMFTLATRDFSWKRSDDAMIALLPPAPRAHARPSPEITAAPLARRARVVHSAPVPEKTPIPLPTYAQPVTVGSIGDQRN